jgi:hypothetical protein
MCLPLQKIRPHVKWMHIIRDIVPKNSRKRGLVRTLGLGPGMVRRGFDMTDEATKW